MTYFTYLCGRALLISLFISGSVTSPGKFSQSRQNCIKTVVLCEPELTFLGLGNAVLLQAALIYFKYKM